MTTDPSTIWARVAIVVHPNKKVKDEIGAFKVNYYEYHVIKQWDYPKWIIDKHRWFFTWVQALIQCRFPKHYVSYHHGGYYPETKERLGSKRLSAISAAKAQVTKVENAIAEFIEEKSKTIWSDYENDPIYKKLLCKLDDKKFKLQQAVMQEVEETI